jgi:hypothetical protein
MIMTEFNNLNNLHDITNLLDNNKSNLDYILDNKFVFECQYNSISITILDYPQIYSEKDDKIKYIIYPNPTISYNVKDLIYLIVNKKVDTEIIYNKNVLDLTINLRINNEMRPTKLHFINSKIIDFYNEYYQYSLKLNNEKDNLIIQNSFESLRQKLINLKRLGYYSFLLNDIMKISNKYKPTSPINNDKHCVIM